MPTTFLRRCPALPGTRSLAARAACLALGLALALATMTLTAAPSQAAGRSSDEVRAAELLDTSRRSAGLAALAGCAELDAVAQKWSRSMASSGKLAHNPRVSDQIGAWSAWGENVGYAASVDKVHRALLDSPAHRANMLSTTYTQVGLGVATSGGRTWITQVFRRPKGGTPCTSVVATTTRAPLPEEVSRVAGRDRHETAVELSQQTFGRAATVIVASSERFPEALIAGPLAAELGSPVLLSRADRLHPATRAEIDRLGASRAIVLGSTASLSRVIDEELAGLGLDVERLAGADRFETSARIAERVGGRTAVIAKGVDPGWADAIAASGYAAHRGLPILLVDGERLDGSTRRALRSLGVDRVEIVGGAAAVSDGVERALQAEGISTQRLAGANRLATSARVAEASVAAGMSPDTVWLSTARNWADALAAGPVVARDGGVLLLSEPDGLSPREAPTQWLDARGDEVDEVVLIGGPAALADDVGHDAAAAISD